MTVQAAGPTGAPPARHILLVIAHLRQGGAQKVLVSLANEWARSGFEITLVSMGAVPDPLYFKPHARVRIVDLDLAEPASGWRRAFANNIRRLILLRQIIRQSGPDVVLSFLSITNTMTLIATRGLGIPVLVSERGDPDRATLSLTWRQLRRLAYPWAFRLIAQTEFARDRFKGKVRDRAVVIPNPVEGPAEPLVVLGRKVAGVGHLVEVKGFDLLIEAFARTTRRYPDWQLVLWGEGPDRNALLDQAARLGIGDRVRLPGRSAKPGGWLGDTSIFVLSSRNEGFPNALLEAMASGLPVIAADAPVGGPRSMITSEKDGLLVAAADVDALAQALEALMGDPEKRQRLGASAFLSAQRYAAPAITQRWTALIEEAIAGNRRSLSGAEPRPPALARAFDDVPGA